MDGARPAGEGDLARVAELCRTVVSELGSQDRGGALFAAREAREEPVEDSLKAQLADPRSTVVVGTIDDVVVGYGTGRLEPLRDGTVLGVIDELFVEAGGRGVGVGHAVMEALLSWFGAQGCSGVDSLALPGMRASKNFFEASGFTARLIVMHRRLPGT